MIAVTFALPDESLDFFNACDGVETDDLEAGLDRRLDEQIFSVKTHIGRQPVCVVYTGVGARHAAQWSATLAAQKFAAAIISGFAGGLRPGVRAGDLVLGENVSDPGLVESARAALAGEVRLHVGALTTQAHTVETAADKAALHRASGGALAVDMETAWIAAACRDAGVPTLALRVISDGADDDFPVPGLVMFDQEKQRPRVVALPLWLLAHPTRIAPFVRFVRGLGPARRRLAAALERVIGKLRVES